MQSSRTVVADGVKQAISMNASGPAVFAALGARLIEGRDLQTRDAKRRRGDWLTDRTWT